jgi:hypothetical protein
VKYTLFFVFLLIANSLAFSDETVGPIAAPKSPEDDQAKLLEYQQRCQYISALVVKNSFRLDCFSNYHHYYPSSNSRLNKSGSQVRIAGYNLLHPGTSKALFKDYSLVAKVANHFDVVSGLEVLPTVSHDEHNNQAVIKLYLQNKDVKTATALYRAPGYYRLLTELKKLDPSWGLILSPRGDAAQEGSVEEMVAYFYRGSVVTPITNPHCQEFKDNAGGTPYACLINLRANFMGRDLSRHYSRRPFMASFQSGRFKFTVLSNHIVFGYSGDASAQAQLLSDTFGTTNLDQLGSGINNSNFARFAEMKNTLDFMSRYVSRYKDQNIMYVGDTNLTPTIPFWSDILKTLPGSSLLIGEPTTISPTRYSSDGKETFGVASSYDHFVLNPKVFTNCNAGEVYNYYQSDVNADIQRVYGIKPTLKNKSSELYTDEDAVPVDGEELPLPEDMGPLKLDYPLTPLGQSKMDKFVQLYTNYLNSLFTVKNGQIVQDDFQIPERLDGLRKRVFLKQLTNPFYYRYYQELLSDHFPVSITCNN